MPRAVSLRLTFGVLAAVFLTVLFVSVKKMILIGMEKKIIQSIYKANYCQANEDCALVMYRCPFGCGAYLNKKEVAGINKMISWYFSLKPRRCINSCAVPVSPICQSNKCMPRSCALNKDYEATVPGPCSCPAGSTYTTRTSKSGQTMFRCTGQKILKQTSR